MKKIIVLLAAFIVSIVSWAYDSQVGDIYYNISSSDGMTASDFSYYSESLSHDVSIPIDEEHFPDSNFRNYLKNNVDTDGSGELSESEIQSVTSIKLYMRFVENLKGIEYFTNLTELNCHSNYLVALDLSKNTKLEKLESDGNKRMLKESVTWDGFTLDEIDMSRVDPNTVFGAKIVDGKFVPNNSSTIAYDYATGLTDEGVSTVRLQLSYSMKKRVTFFGKDGEVISYVDVDKGESATAPVAPKYDGFTFKAWSESFDEVYYDTDVYALYDVVSGGTADIYKVAIDAVNFPDEEFREVVTDFDTNNDGYLTTAELYAVTEIDAKVSLITDIKGIEYFTELNRLVVSYNSLTEIDLSKNTKLTTINCEGNKLTKLDLSNNEMLKYVFCSKNEIEDLTLPKNNKIKSLEIENNKIEVIDVSSMPNLTTFKCAGNELVYVGNFNVESTSSDHIFSSFSGNDNVRDIELDGDIITLEGADMSRIFNLKGAYLSADGLDVISNRITYDYYVGNCVHVSTVDQLFLNVTLNVITDDDGIEINEKNFPDQYFRDFVSAYDTDENGKLSKIERKGITEMEVSGYYLRSIVGVEYFTRLEELVCSSSLDTIDVAALTELKTLKLCNGGSYGHFKRIDLSKNTKLTDLYISSDSLKNLDLSALTELKTFEYRGKNLETVDMSNNLKLDDIDVQLSNIKYLDLSKNSLVRYITVSNCYELETLLLPETDNYVNINANSCEKLKGLDFTKTPNIGTLRFDDCNFTELDFIGCKKLFSLYCRNNRLAWIDLSFNKTSSWSTFDLSGNIYDAGLVDAEGFTIEGLDMSRVTLKEGGEIVNGKFVPNEGVQEMVYSFATGWSRYPSADFTVSFYTKDNLGVAIDEENFPDEVFRNYVIDNYDSDKNGYLRSMEIRAVQTINIRGDWVYEGSWGHLEGYGDMPSSLKGIEFFPYLNTLNVEYSLLSEVDLSKNTAIKIVQIDKSRMISIDLSSNTKVNHTFLYGSRIVNNPDYEGFTIEGLDMSKVTVTDGGSVVDGKFVPESDETESIIYTFETGAGSYPLYVTLHLVKDGMKVTKIDEETFPDDVFRWTVSVRYDKDADGYLTPDEVSGLTYLSFASLEIEDFTGIEAFYNLEEFSGYDNKVAKLDLSYNTKLVYVNCDSNQLFEIKLPENNVIEYLSLNNNNFESIALPSCTQLKELKLINNRLTSIDLSACANLEKLYLNYNQLTSLDLSECKKLKNVQFNNNKLPYVDLTGHTINNPSADDQIIEIGEVSMEGFAIEGLDMSRVSISIGSDGSKVDGKFVPCSSSSTSITYEFDMGNTSSWYNHHMKVTVKFTVIPGTPISSITIDNDGPAEYYDLQGRRISGPVRGLVIKKQNGMTTKMLVK